MYSKVISIDLAKDVFEIAIANKNHRIIERQRLSRTKFARFITCQEPALVIMEACGSAHFWARQAVAAGHQVNIIPAQYVRPYRRRGKTDRIDTEALLNAHRCAGITPVPIRSVEQQQIQQLHRVREQWKKTRNQRINGLRGFLRELGFTIPEGAACVDRRTRIILEAPDIPLPLKSVYLQLLEEIRFLAVAIKNAEKELTSLTRSNHAVQQLQQVPGIGTLTSTALVAAIGSPHRFSNGRKLASWLGLTPREHSSGNKRFLGHISKEGDRYLRTLITHGARSVLARTKQIHKAGKPMTPLQHWVWKLQARVGHNKATCALANKLARICWAVWVSNDTFNPEIAAA